MNASIIKPIAARMPAKAKLAGRFLKQQAAPYPRELAAEGLRNAPKKIGKDFKNLITTEKSIGEYLWWYGLLAPLGNAVFGPVLLNREYKKKGWDDKERKTLVFQEALGQTINVLLHWTSFVGATALAAKFWKGRGMAGAITTGVKSNLKNEGVPKAVRETIATAQANRTEGLFKTAVAGLGSFIGMSFIRPGLSAKILDRWNKGQEAASQAEAASNSAALAMGQASSQSVPSVATQPVPQPSASAPLSQPSPAIPPPGSTLQQTV